jgi:dienelactone hydrolase
VGLIYEREDYGKLTFTAFPLSWLTGEAAGDDQGGLPAKLAPHFSPPDEFAGDFGKYKSALFFKDGRKVKAADEWPARRKEILDDWHKMLGPWPEMVKEPKIRFGDKERRENLTQHKVEVQVSDSGQFTEGHLLVPDGEGPFPAVLVTFYDSATSVGLAERGRGTHDYGLQLARRGFVTLSIGTPGSIEQPDKQTRELLTDAGERQERQPLTFLAYVAANCHTALSQLPQVDGERIGIVGLSYGGKWAMFASCLYEKFACAVWSDPGIVFNEENSNVNYWEPWYLGYEEGVRRRAGVPNDERPRTGLYKRLIDEGRDLNELHALMCPRPVLVAGGTEDPPRNWRALNHLIEINRLLGYENRVAMTHRATHIPTPEALEKTLAFLAAKPQGV